MIWIIAYFIIVVVSSVLIYKKKDGFLFYFIVALAFIAPYSDITKVSLYGIFVRLVLPAFVITYFFWKFNDLKRLLLFSFKSYLKYTFMVFGLLILIFCYDAFALHLKASKISISYYLKYFELLWSVAFFLILFARLTGVKRLLVFNKIHFIVLVIASLIGFLTYMHIPFVYSFHQNMYNKTFVIYDEVREVFNYVIWYNRPYSIFSASNQFGVFASLSLILSFYFFDERVIGKTKLIISIILQLLILISSQSRTGFIFYIFIAGILYLKKTDVKKMIMMIPVFIPLLILMYFVLPDRIIELFSGNEGLIEVMGAQRIYFWAKFYNSLTWDSLISGLPWLVGGKEQFTFFESGYFNIYFEGGIGFVLLHFIHLRKIGRFRVSNLNIKSFAFLYSLVFILSEFLQGSFITTRYVLINGMVIAYLIIKRYEEWQVLDNEKLLDGTCDQN
ncbi:MAG: hypothetical protein JW717_05445 [Marinilabiliaceae bacterium]|nr:hypothetical protein [Marinilabiliaceae bacterium]